MNMAAECLMALWWWCACNERKSTLYVRRMARVLLGARSASVAGDARPAACLGTLLDRALNLVHRDDGRRRTLGILLLRVAGPVHRPWYDVVVQFLRHDGWLYTGDGDGDACQ